jgi:nitrite reductase/ring-hydroxylating ferredoxin subunit
MLILPKIKPEMPTSPKLKYFFLILVITSLLISCEKNKNDVIPYEYVDFTIDLLDFPNIYNLVGSDTVDAGDQRIDYARYAGGYNGNGIIIFSGADGYYAYDRTCPHEYVDNGQSVKVIIDFTIARCPKCNTTYALAASGTPASGPGRYPLKNYRTILNGRYLTVQNY